MNNSVAGRVTKVNKTQFIVTVEEKELTAALCGKLQYRKEYPVIGDHVSVQITNGDMAVIQEIRPRTSYLSRPDRSGHADGFVKNYQEQIMAANLDYLFIITSMNDDFSVNRITRFVATSIKGGCRPVIILTKADLCPDKDRYLQQVCEINDSIDAFCISSHTGEGIDKIRKYMQPGITIGLMGSSGVGKSTLINTLAGYEAMKVSGIREKDSKGRHTTTHREMLNIHGTFFIDTPGMREFGVGDVEEGLSETFDDIVRLTQCCRFGDCSHQKEPGCAIKAALADGSLPKERWILYRSLLTESNRTRDMTFKKRIAIQS